jgi:hypothetical protein
VSILTESGDTLLAESGDTLSSEAGESAGRPASSGGITVAVGGCCGCGSGSGSGDDPGSGDPLSCECFAAIGENTLTMTFLDADCPGLAGLSFGLFFETGVGTPCGRNFWEGLEAAEGSPPTRFGLALEASAGADVNYVASSLVRCGCDDPASEELYFEFSVFGLVVLGVGETSVCGAGPNDFEWGYRILDATVVSFNCDPLEIVLSGTIVEYDPTFCTPCEGQTVTIVITE